MNRKLRVALAGAAALGALVVPVTASASPSVAAAPPHTRPTLTDQQRRVIVGKFATAVVNDDHAGIEASTTPDFVWTIPGGSQVSGVTRGRAAVSTLVDTFARFALHIDVHALTFGVDTVAVEVHDTGDHDGKKLDQDVVNILTIRDGKVSSASGNFADVQAFDAYFSWPQS